MRRSTIARDVAVHFWPVLIIAPLTTCPSACSRSASASTIAGFFPPSSSCSFAPRSAAKRRSSAPVSFEPVKEMATTRGSRTSGSPTFAADPVTRFSTPARQPSLVQRFHQAHRGERGQAGRFEDDGVAEGERRSDLPGRNRDREVPRRDHGHDPERLARGVEQRVRVHRGIVLAARLLGLAGKIAQDLDRASRLADALLERLALFPGQLAPNLGDAGFENVGGLVEDVRPRDRRAEPPAAVGLLSGGDRGIDVGGARRGEETDDLVPVGRVAVLHRLAAGGRSPLAGDVVSVGLNFLGGLGPRRGRNHFLFSLCSCHFVRDPIVRRVGPVSVRTERQVKRR